MHVYFEPYELLYSFFLGDISRPGKNGAPTVMPNGEDLLPCARKSTSSTEAAIDHVITKTFKQFDIPFQITDNIRSILQLNFEECENLFLRKGGTRKKQQLESWKDEKSSTWYININETKIKTQLL